MFLVVHVLWRYYLDYVCQFIACICFHYNKLLYADYILLVCIKEAIYIIVVYTHICIQVPYSTNVASSFPMYNIKE